MQWNRHRLSLGLAILLALSCASPNKLAMQSERELTRGEPRRAYETARSAVRREPENARARAAMTAAAVQLLDEWKARILNIASADTVAAARYAIELSGFRGELAQYRIAVPPDSGFARLEARIRNGAAAHYYDAGEQALAEGRPKEAYRNFQATGEFVPGYRDARKRMDEAHRRALARVAILPFADQTGVPGLSKTLGDRMFDQILGRTGSRAFAYTQLVERDQVYRQMTVAELDDLPRDRALALGKKLDADRVVVGRYYGLRSSTSSDQYHETIFRKVAEKDPAGASVERYVEVSFDAVARERRVQVRWDMEVLDTRSGTSLARRSEPVESVARVVFTSYQAEGEPRDYCLVPPDWKKAEPDRVKQVEQRWKERFGSWSVPGLLEQAHKQRERSRYDTRYRTEFLSDTRERPVFLGELPGENDMAFVALDRVWEPVYRTLRELDEND